MSYSETHSDYLTNDTHTAQDSNKFVRGFLKHYPAYAKNDFYIIGKARQQIGAAIAESDLPAEPCFCT